MTAAFEPNIIAFLCNWCSYEGADAAGRARLECPSRIKAVRLMCSGRADPDFILEAFKGGADGVLVLGCAPGNCHYKNGNLETLKRITLLKKVLGQYGLGEERLVLDWISAGEGEKFAAVVQAMVAKIKKMGPI